MRFPRRFRLLPVLFWLILSLTVSLPAEAQQFPVSRHTLKNGMTVLISEDHSLPIACFCVFFKVGSRNERPGITGISHVVEHLRFSSGTERFPPKEFDRIIEAAGGYTNGATTKDYTYYWEEFASSALETILELEADRMQNLKIEAANFAREVGVVKEERLLRTENDVFGTMYEQLFANAYLAHPYRWPVIGWMGDLEAITLEQVRHYLATYYSPSNAVAILVGDLEEASALALMERYFSPIPSQPAPPPVVNAEPPQRGERRVWVKKEAELPALMIAYRAPSVTSEDLYPLSLLESILSAGESSYIYRRLVYEQQIATSAWAGLHEAIDPGLFLFYAQMKPGHEVREAEESLQKILEEIQLKGVREEDLQKAKNIAQAQFIRGVEGNASRARLLGYYEVAFGDYQHLFQILEKLNRVGREEIQRVAREYFDPDRRTTLTLIPLREGR
ncbi:MAG: pitrilysin family protein [candidate division NC10 bacterium]|nr:pitrilysin family protein [candidate division NC10 bacterium]